jgi:hypothetical protein
MSLNASWIIQRTFLIKTPDKAFCSHSSVKSFFYTGKSNLLLHELMDFPLKKTFDKQLFTVKKIMFEQQTRHDRQEKSEQVMAIASKL